MTTTVNQTKCACPSCVCMVTLTEAIAKDGKYYCSDACAQGHPNGQGCGCGSCNCNN